MTDALDTIAARSRDERGIGAKVIGINGRL